MTAPGDVHANAQHNDHDIQFLHNMVGSLDGTAALARSVITNGSHPDVQGVARTILSMSTDQAATVGRLASQIGHAAAVATTGSTGTGGHGGGGGGGGDGDGGGRSAVRQEERAALTGAQESNLPDSAFAYIEPGGQKDAQGKTTPRSKRHFPIHDAAHVRNALERAPQSPFGKQAMPKIMAAAKKYGVNTSQSMNSREPGAVSYRSAPFRMQRSSNGGGDGLTLEGYAAVFNSPTLINSWEGEFEETIAPGAFARSLRDHSPVLMFEHGKHPLIGSMPLGVITSAREDSNGLHIEARLSDNWLIQPVRDAVRDGAVTGMSFRFSVPEGGDKLVTRSGQPDLRIISEANVAELGPVVFPAYEPTTASIRSLVEHLPDHLTGRPDAWSAGGGDFGASLGNGDTSSPTDQQHLDDGALQARGIK